MQRITSCILQLDHVVERAGASPADVTIKDIVEMKRLVYSMMGYVQRHEDELGFLEPFLRLRLAQINAINKMQ